MSERDDKIKAALGELSDLKDKIVGIFADDEVVGKDVVLDVSNALDAAHARVSAAAPVEGHDLNVDLAASPEDHPAVQGQVPTPIEMDPNVNEQSPTAPAQPVVSGAPQDAAPVQTEPVDQPAVASAAPDDAEHRVGPEGEPHAPDAA